jgi:transcriptional regulator with XRE-family HTH domain
LDSERPELLERAAVNFAARIVELRKSRGWSQEDLAEKADLHRTYIGSIERAKKNVSIYNIAKLAQAFQVPIAELFPHRERTALLSPPRGPRKKKMIRSVRRG